ncbi:MAG: agmatinase family protein [Oligoflexia bacterium]|nr:agmatinase family protein [Oligoflexia bacterium]
MSFDPNAASTADSGVFGLPFAEADSSLVYLPVPWEATTSYGGGTSGGPKAILEASRQVDLYDADVLKPYEAGLFMREESAEIRAWNEEGRALASKIIEAAGVVAGNPELERALARVNALGGQVNELVRSQTRELLQAGKIVGVVGGDHSVPFGALQAVAEKHKAFGVLHFDAHLDLRRAYEGFEWSHASIMHNVLERIPAVTKLVQVGIRDYCEEEAEFAAARKGRISVYSDRDCSRRKFEGATWGVLAREMIAELPESVWISFDIDGLDPRFCPHTGTPVPGGLDFQEANYLLSTLVKSGRKIIGFDLNEVAPSPDGDEWDANVGARMLYKLSGWTLASLGKAKVRNE